MRKLNVLTGIIFFGSAWGMLEATVGAFLHLINFPLKGAVMMSLGVFIMSAGLSLMKPKNPLKFTLGVGVVAAALKGFDVLLPGPAMAFLVVARPMTAIVVESLALGLAVKLLQKNYYSSQVTAPTAGAASAYLSYLGFGLAFTYLKLGSNYWLNKTINELFMVTITEGSQAALLCGLGGFAGHKVGAVVSELQTDLFRSRFFYPTLALVVVCCWSSVLL